MIYTALITLSKCSTSMFLMAYCHIFKWIYLLFMSLAFCLFYVWIFQALWRKIIKRKRNLSENKHVETTTLIAFSKCAMFMFLTTFVSILLGPKVYCACHLPSGFFLLVQISMFWRIYTCNTMESLHCSGYCNIVTCILNYVWIHWT